MTSTPWERLQDKDKPQFEIVRSTDKDRKLTEEQTPDNDKIKA